MQTNAIVHTDEAERLERDAIFKIRVSDFYYNLSVKIESKTMSKMFYRLSLKLIDEAAVISLKHQLLIERNKDNLRIEWANTFLQNQLS